MERDWVVLKIEDDRMTVSLSIKVPYGEEFPSFSPEFIENYLKENGITAGIDHKAIEALSAYVQFGQEIVVARGKAPINGNDGVYQYLIELEDAKSKPVLNSDGSVDYYNSLKLAMVKKDQLFAVYVPATAGEYGYTVFSEMLAPVKGRDLRPLKGKGFVVSDDGKEYRAAVDGRIYRQQDRIIIDNMYVVKGDLDIEQGNIVFNGDVEIKGDVRSGLMINAQGSIFIHGHVGGCRLISGGNITIKKGIQGRNKCTIVAKNDVICSFIERCTINAGGSIYADSILDSDVAARVKVNVNSRKGIIVGGNVSGMQGIYAKEVGNEAGVTTVLQAGAIPEHMRTAALLSEQLEQIKKDVSFLDKNLKIYEALPGDKRTKETEATRMKILRAKVIKATEQKDISDKLNAMNEEIDKAKSQAIIKITGNAYAGTKITMGKAMHIVKDSCRDVEFTYRNYEIIASAGLYRG